MLINRLWQTILPKHWLSRWAGKIADCPNPKIKNWLCNKAIKAFDIKLGEAHSIALNDYPTFNDFFDRYLLPNVRPIDKDKQSIISPADGVLSECGQLIYDDHSKQQTLIQAKNKSYSLAQLINDEELSKQYHHGSYATIYLSPRDYHRVHNPFDGTLLKSEYIPGELFAVNENSVNAIDNLFSRNERLICHIETSIGRVLVIFVGALLVSGIRAKWLDGKPKSGIHQLTKSWFFSKGAELGLFRFGSTVILIFPPDKIENIIKYKGQFVQMGQAIANLKK